MSVFSDVAFSSDSSELNESYDPAKEFEEMIDKEGLRAPLPKRELLWRKAMYCRYRCRLVNIDQHAPQNTWAEVAHFVRQPDWKELRIYSTQKFLQLPVVDDSGTRDIIDVVASYASASQSATKDQQPEAPSTDTIAPDMSKVEPWQSAAESGSQSDSGAVFTLVCEDEIVKQPLASSPSQAKRILERKSLVDHLSFVVQRKMKLFFVDEAQLMSKEQWSLAW